MEVRQMEKRFISVNAVTKMLSVSAPTINRWIFDGTIPSYKVQKRRLFDLDEIIAWVKAQKDDGRKHRKPKGRKGGKENG
jgi:excisionase family DNA binding protein